MVIFIMQLQQKQRQYIEDKFVGYDRLQLAKKGQLALKAGDAKMTHEGSLPSRRRSW
jgi:hypothetical protein